MQVKETIRYAKKYLEETEVATQHRSSHNVSGTPSQVFSELFVYTLPQPLLFPVYNDRASQGESIFRGF